MRSACSVTLDSNAALSSTWQQAMWRTGIHHMMPAESTEKEVMLHMMLAKLTEIRSIAGSASAALS